MANNRTLKLTFTAITTSAQARVRSLTDEVTRLENAYSRVEQLNDRLNRPQSFNRDPFLNLIKNVERLSEVQGEILNNFGDLQNGLNINPFEQVTQSADRLVERMQEIRGEFQAINNTANSNRLSKPLENAEKSASSLSDKLNKVSDSFKKIGTEKAFNTVRKSFETPIELKFVIPKLPEIVVKAESQVPPIQRIERENREIRAKQQIQKDNEIEKRQKQRDRDNNKAQKLLDEIQGKPKASDFIGDSFQRKKSIEPYLDEERASRRRKRQESLREYQARFGSFRERAEYAKESGSADEDAVKFAQKKVEQRKKELEEEKAQKRLEIEAKIKELEAQKKQREQERKEREEQVKSFQRSGGTYNETNRGIGFGINTLNRDKAPLPKLRNVAGQFGLDLIENRAPLPVQEVIKGTQILSQAFGVTGLAATALGGILAIGLVGALETASFFVKKFQEQLDEARKDQLASISVTSESSRLLGLSIEDSKKYYESVQVKSEIAGRDTSVEAKDIVALNRTGQSSFERAFGGQLNSEQIAEKLVNVNKRFAVLGQITQGVTPFQIQNAYTSAITGNLDNAIKRQEFFRNSGIGEVIKDIASKEGLTIKELSPAEQINLLEKALETQVNDKVINRAQDDSIDAQFSRINDVLFANRTGYFGIQRDTDLNTEGVQSVFTELTRTVNLFIGRDGLFSEISKTLDTLLPDYDVMNDLRISLKALNDGLEFVNNVFKDINSFFDKIANSPIGKAVSEVDKIFSHENFVKTVDFRASFDENTKRAETVKDLQNTGNNFWSWVGGLFGFKPSYAGNIPGDSGVSTSLLNAIAIENRNKPVGSNLVIANDSEFIFTNQQMQQLLFSNAKPMFGGNTSSGRVINVHPGAIVVNSQSHQNSQEIAYETIRMLESMIESEI